MLGTGGAVTFGGLNVTPRGPQNLNLETGATDFPQGGTVTDARSGLKLTAGHLQLQPGERLHAQEATLTTRQGGTLRAEAITYDLKAGMLSASGNVTYTDARLKNLTAGQMVLHLKTGFVTARGGVRAATPPLSAQTLAFDTRTAQALLSGQARLSAQGTPAQTLLLTFSGHRLIRAQSSPDAATLRRFAPYLK